MTDFTVVDRRGSRQVASSGSQFVTDNLDAHMRNLRAAGHTLPYSDVAAGMETQETLASVNNRTLTSAMGARRQATYARTGMTHTGANVQMALPKVRKPMSTLEDKGIPFDTTNEKDLHEIRRWGRLFYTTHDLVPLLIDIYAKFPIIGLEFDCKDPKITEFYNEMFFDTLDYENFLQDLGREYFISGEVNSYAHFSETLGTFSSEEILNPDQLHVSRPLFGTSESEQPKERVQLMVKEMVDNLRQGPGGITDDTLSDSERLERNHEYQMLVKYYPEMIAAAARDDGLDISDALISRIVNKVQPWDVRGTPHILRSFKTLMMEESLNAAQDAVADRLYSPFILAQLGIANMGDDAGPWIPNQVQIDAARDSLQAALAADFRLMVHHFGLEIKSVFGRESVPRFDTDYSRIDKKLLQAWGIGEALISGGTGTVNYASTALNREFVTQMMLTFQKGVRRHIRKRMIVVAEAQEHFDYESKNGRREPIYRTIVEYDPDTGEEYLRKVPKLLIPDIKFASLNLRDEAQERSFLQVLKQAGVPISDHALAVNVPIEFEDELDKQSEETVAKFVAQAQAMKKAYEIIKAENLPIPPEMAKYLAAQSQLEREESMADRAGIDNDKAETDADMAEQTKDQFAETGIMPGAGGAAGAEGGEGEGSGPNDMDNGIANSIKDAPDQGSVSGEGSEDNGNGKVEPRNRSRPPESDEQRKNAPKAASLTDDKGKVIAVRFGRAPSSLGSSNHVGEERVQEAIHRLTSRTPTVHELIVNRSFYATLNRIEADFEPDWVDLEAFHFASDTEREGFTAEIRERYAELDEMLDQFDLVHGVQPQWA